MPTDWKKNNLTIIVSFKDYADLQSDWNRIISFEPAFEAMESQRRMQRIRFKQIFDFEGLAQLVWSKLFDVAGKMRMVQNIADKHILDEISQGFCLN